MHIGNYRISKFITPVNPVYLHASASRFASYALRPASGYCGLSNPRWKPWDWLCICGKEKKRWKSYYWKATRLLLKKASH